jgi:hypothetical protein
MKTSKTPFSLPRLCICSLFLASIALLGHNLLGQDRSSGSPRQAQGAGLRSGKAEPVSKSAYQQELERLAPEITKALQASGRALPKTGAEAQGLGATLASEGYKRLEDSVLLEMISMRAAMAEVADEQFCAAMWTGSYVWDMAAAPILYLPDDRQRRLAQITVAAELAEIQNTPPKRDPPSDAEAESALERLFSGLRADDARFLMAAFRSPLNMRTRDQCRATRLYYPRLREMAPKDALVIFRLSLYD